MLGSSFVVFGGKRADEASSEVFCATRSEFLQNTGVPIMALTSFKSSLHLRAPLMASWGFLWAVPKKTEIAGASFDHIRFMKHGTGNTMAPIAIGA